MRLTKKERQAIAALQALAARWPKTLGLFSDGSLHVIKLRRGQWPMKKGHTPWGVCERMDQDYKVAIIQGIKTDGGDPW